MMADTTDDAVSLTSSCEIVEALEDAVNDVNEAAGDLDNSENKESSPPVELSWINDSSMTASQYAQVVFNDIKDSYPIDLDLELSYTLTSFIQAGHGDRICLYKLPYLQPHEYVAYVWSKQGPDNTVTVKFPVSTLPKEEDFYQFQYLKGDNQVAGASVPFQLRKPGNSSQAVCGVTEEDDLLVVETSQTSLQQKYSSLLDLSEKLTEELNKKNESFIVLEQRHMSLLESSKASQDIHEDLQSLVRDKIQLEKTLTQTTETLNRSESLLNVTTKKLEETELNLEQKQFTITELEKKIVALEASRGEDVEKLNQERDSLARMLDQEIKSREALLKEKQELVDRLENTNSMLVVATNSKDLAVAEIRALIEQQDGLRKEIASLKEEVGHTEAELVVTKQQLVKFTENQEDSYVVTTVLSSMGEKLEAKERELKQKDDEINILKELEASKNTIEIHERCLEDADSRATALENENRGLIHDNKRLVDENSDLSEENRKLTTKNKELTARLEAGAEHYRKLAAEKKKLETNSTSEIYVTKIDSLETKITKLTEELRQARMLQDVNLSEIKSAVSSHSNNSSLVGEGRELSLDTVSSTSNMDSVRIQEAVMSSSQVRSSPEPAVKMPMPSLFNPIVEAPIANTNTGAKPKRGVPNITLPVPLIPDNVGPTSIPELVPRRPAPYSMGAAAKPAATQLNCPLCEVTFPSDQIDKLQEHVNRHIDDTTKTCPMCPRLFDKDTSQRDYEEHVQEHFEQQQSIRGWDLGID